MVRRGRFELYDNASSRLYAGSVSDDAKQQIDGFAVGHASYVAATLKVEIDFAAEDETAGHKYTLVSVRQLDADADVAP